MNPGLTVKRAILLLGDILVLYGALATTLAIRYGTLLGTPAAASHFRPFSVLFVFWIALFYINNLYDMRGQKNTGAWRRGLAGALTASAVVSIVFFYLVTDYGIAPKTNLFVFLIAASGLMYGWRSLYNAIVRRRVPLAETLVMGETVTAMEIMKAIRENPQLGYRLTKDPAQAELVIVPPAARADTGLATMLYRAAAAGITVTDTTSFYEAIMKKLPVAELEPAWFLGKIANRKTVYDFVREPVETAVAFALAVVTLPVTLLIALAVGLTSKGPVIFRQKRVGAFGKEFVLLKFRSMVANSPDGSAEAGTGAVWKTANDPRFTKIGRFLERTHLDELPQLMNIMRGEASFVGPRPERPAFVEELAKTIPYYDLRHLVKPGIAGWAQLNYKYGASAEDAYEKLQYDLWYLKNRSFWLDLSIIAKTARLFIARN